MKRSDQATYVPGPEQVRSSLKQQLKAKNLKDDREVPSKKVAVPKPRIPPARIPGFGTATFFAWHLPVIFNMFGFELLLQG